MSEQEINPLPADEVACQRKMTIKNRHRAVWLLGASFIGGVVAWGGAWLIQGPSHDAWMAWNIGMQACLYLLILANLFLMRKARCPQCGYDWDRHSRSKWILGASFFIGVVIVGGAWLIEGPSHAERAITFWLESNNCLLYGLVFVLLPLMRKKSCPGCGLKMSDDTGCHERP
ncbi:MAG: hypothetical protein ABI042_08300 [Verrucomicrobiota bacterium]